MILIDYSGVALRPIVMENLGLDEDLLRHAILNSIRLYRKKFKAEYGEVVIATDAGGNWRKQIFPEYKANRKTGRDESKLDWNEVFRILNMVRDEIKENFPYKVVSIQDAEADDIIGTIVEYTQEFGNYEPVMIVSSDKDFAQLQKYDNVSQYSYATKKLIKEKDPEGFLFKHILTGDGGDGVPNVLMGDRTFVEGTRQSPMTQKKINAWLNSDDLQRDMGDTVYRNYLRNKKMIDLSETPEALKREIINSFVEQDQTKNKMKVMNFLIKKKCRLLLENTGDFIK